jgi:hypothetical protein
MVEQLAISAEAEPPLLARTMSLDVANQESEERLQEYAYFTVNLLWKKV